MLDCERLSLLSYRLVGSLEVGWGFETVTLQISILYAEIVRNCAYVSEARILWELHQHIHNILCM